MPDVLVFYCHQSALTMLAVQCDLVIQLIQQLDGVSCLGFAIISETDTLSVLASATGRFRVGLNRHGIYHFFVDASADELLEDNIAFLLDNGEVELHLLPYTLDKSQTLEICSDFCAASDILGKYQSTDCWD